MQHLLALISMHALHYKKEYLWMISASTHPVQKTACFKHPIVVRVHRSSNSKLLNYDLIHIPGVHE